MKVETKRFGQLEVAENQVVIFTEGLPGFPEARRFIFVDIERDCPLKFMQSVDDPGLAFLVAEPLPFFPDYRAVVRPEELAPLALERPEQGIVVGIVSVPADFKEATINLKAPIIINPQQLLARQVILEGDYDIRTPLFARK
ncbi:flagellar assembly protein FliW [Thermodesulfitimonas sp.]